MAMTAIQPELMTLLLTVDCLNFIIYYHVVVCLSPCEHVGYQQLLMLSQIPIHYALSSDSHVSLIDILHILSVVNL